MTYHILSLSGGGIRGLFQAVYLRDVERRLGRPLRECFDLIAGTSTGAIIAVGVALGIPLRDIVELFRDRGHEIFPPNIRKRSKLTLAWFCKGPRYPHVPLKTIFDEVYTNKRLRDCGPSVIVAAATLDSYETRAFTTLNGKDNDLLASQVVLSSAAAPLFFPAYRPRDSERTYVDGGIWANNPALLAVLAAHRECKVAFHDMRLISVGNGEVPSGKLGVDFNQMRRMRMIEPVLDMMFATQSELADRTAAYLLDDYPISGARMLRVNVQMHELVELDNVAAAIQRLVPLAEGKAESADAGYEAFGRLVKPRITAPAPTHP
jgi:uncharacterized protein